MIIDPNNPNTIYAGGEAYSGTNSVMSVCKSTDGGFNWTRNTLSPKSGGVNALALHPTNTNILFAGGVCDSTSAGKVMKSTDGGANWSDASAGLTQDYNIVYALAIDPTAPNIMYAGCNYGVFKSTDGGSNWTNLNTPFSSVQALLINTVTSPAQIYAGSSYAGMYYSIDGGASWNPMNEGLSNLQINCLAFDPQQKLLFVGTNGGGVFRREISTQTVAPPQPQLPAKLALKANYPNPFNAMTTITYEVPANTRGFSHLMIFNGAGQMVRKLMDAFQPPGQYQMTWDGLDENGTAVASGIYICVLSAGNQRVTTKMMLVR
ncbi:MAG: T9SS type A sorting domain-containing protein [candidate division KSB1 bacterium]|nr:T9SS type A sorting domain-containing protein [candidate division KSB1 bacterium]